MPKDKTATRRTAKAAPRRRRGGDEVHRLILEAARDLFAHKGYAGTSTREIAEQAGVYEPMIYRRFESKAKLFQAAVLDPFEEVVSAYLQTWAAQAPSGDVPLDDVARAWVGPFFRAMRDNRPLVLALLVAEEFYPEEFAATGRSLATEIRRVVDRMVPQAEIEAARRPLYDVDISAMVAVGVGMIMGTALLSPAAAPGEDQLTDHRLLEELVRFTVSGVAGRSGAGREADGRPSRGAIPDIGHLLDRAADAERRAIRAELEIEHLTGRPGSGGRRTA
jgi:AcrR family transcriptional regulator